MPCLLLNTSALMNAPNKHKNLANKNFEQNVDLEKQIPSTVLCRQTDRQADRLQMGKLIFDNLLKTS